MAMLIAFQLLTIDEIAVTLSLSREAVKARLHRARKLIREYLQPAAARPREAADLS